MTNRTRKTQRLEQCREWAGKRVAKSEQAFATANDLVKDIPPGQPILVGHHSEKRHRRTIERSHAAMSKGVAHGRMADHHKAKAANIEWQLERSIYSDDPDTVPRLEKRISELEACRDRAKQINAFFRKHKLDLSTMPDEQVSTVLAPLNLAPTEIGDLTMALRYSQHGKGYPAYHLRNLSGNIARQKKRLAVLQNDGKVAAAARYAAIQYFDDRNDAERCAEQARHEWPSAAVMTLDEADGKMSYYVCLHQFAPHKQLILRVGQTHRYMETTP